MNDKIDDRPTPETNLEEMKQTQRYGVYVVKSDFARRLERERDEAREQRDALVEVLKAYQLNYTDKDLQILANCETGMGEISPDIAKREISARSVIAAVEGGAS